MNTAGSVAYGWYVQLPWGVAVRSLSPATLCKTRGVLTLAAAGAFYFAKKNIDQRRAEQAQRNSRPTEKRSWEDRVREFEQQQQQQECSTLKASAVPSAAEAATPSAQASASSPPGVGAKKDASDVGAH